ncbi:MAG: RNA-binding protein [Candidatus Pacearchaeota archaeon]|jgi:RNA recognition motif-containing protein|nr:RNA-binding protein [Candidatus Pacearchaeota archaeon]MDP7520825.1 RNA-binding protein [Candidatus Pacearchaeota archaeon]|tara:strand:+ start:106 stop:429 length:324 start_codon:yes stop_codon:yes gene_type:complete
MSKKLYVGNLPFSVDSEKLKELFSSYGETEEVTIISDKFSGRSKGFGFITFKEDAGAEKAVAEMNGKEVEGRELKVSEAKPMDPDRPRPPRRDFGNRGGGRGNFNRR